MLNTENLMKIIANIQFWIGLISALVLSWFSLYSFLFIYPILPGIGMWWFGLRLLKGYYGLTTRQRTVVEIRRFWFGSLAFNLMGLITCFGLNFYISHQPNSMLEFIDPSGGKLLAIPSLIGTILAIVALLIPAQKVQHLEPQIP
jgi:hypothetical protein